MEEFYGVDTPVGFELFSWFTQIFGFTEQTGLLCLLSLITTR